MNFDIGVFLNLLVETLSYWWLIIPATLLGVVVGAVPGFSAANTIIILLPITLAMEPATGMIFMVVLYTASRLGAGIPAILVNIPGTAGAAATPLDGYPMAVAGRGQQALAISFVSSVLGGLLTTVAALLLIPWLSRLAFHLHSVEMIVVMLFGISLIATISAEDTLKGLIAGLFGLMIGYIGADVVYEAPRGTFGFLELYDKVPLIPALVGLFAISEAFVVIERETILSDKARASRGKPGWGATFEGIRETLVHWKEIIWTSLLGLVIGVIPGAGAAIASFVAHLERDAATERQLLRLVDHAHSTATDLAPDLEVAQLAPGRVRVVLIHDAQRRQHAAQYVHDLRVFAHESLQVRSLDEAWPNAV